MILALERTAPPAGPAVQRASPWSPLRLLAGLALLMGVLVPLRSDAQVLFAEDFDSIAGPTAGGAGSYRFPTGWTLVNRDNRTPDGNVSYVNAAWERREDFAFNVQDSVAFSTSWYSPAGQADDWMITPLIGPLPAAAQLTWNAIAYDASFPDGYEVRVSTTVPTAEGCEAGPQLFSVGAENSSWTARSASLAAQAGQSVYVCFHNNSVDQFVLLIDDVVVERSLNADPEIASVAMPSAYAQIPLSQARPLALSGIVRNNGGAALTNVTVAATVTRGGATVYAQSSPPVASLAPGAASPFSVAGYTPDQAGDYEIAYVVTSAEGDGDPSNSTATRSQTISESVFARDDGIVTGALGIGAGNGGTLGQTFGLVRPDVLRSVTFALNDVASYVGQELVVDVYAVAATPSAASPGATRVASGAPVRPTDALRPLVFADAPSPSPSVREPGGGAALSVAPGDPPTTLLASSVAYVVAAGDSGTYTLALAGGPLALGAGDVFLGVREPAGAPAIPLAQTDSRFTPGTTWVNWPTSPFGTWANNEAFGSQFAKPYVLRANLGAATQQLTGVAGWRQLASPEATTVGAFLDAFWTQGFPGADFAGGGCSVYTFDETAASLADGWTCATSATDALAPGQGVLAYIYEDDDLGTPGTQGPFPKDLPTPAAAAAAPFSSFGLSYTDDPGAPAGAEGWNLLGNPLAAAFDWDLADPSPGVSQAVYVYDPNYLGGDYRTWSRGVGGDLSDGLVPQNQAFFLQALPVPVAFGGRSLTIPAAAVVASDPPLYGRTGAPTPLRLALAVVGPDEEATPVSVAFVAAAEGASAGTDASDAVRLTPAAWPRTVLATASADGTPLATNVLPQAAASPVDLPLTVTTDGWPAGPLALDLAWTGALPDGWTASLLDRAMGTETALAAGGHYRFALDVPEARAAQPSPAGGAQALPVRFRDAVTDGASTGDRFALRIVPAGVVAGTEGPAAGRLALDSPTPNPARGTVTLRYTLPAAEAVSLVVLDALGREVAVLVDGAVEAGRHAVSFTGASLPSGVYLVRLTAGQETQTRRITLLH